MYYCEIPASALISRHPWHRQFRTTTPVRWQTSSKSTLNVVFPILEPFVDVMTGAGLARVVGCADCGVGVTGPGVAHVADGGVVDRVTDGGGATVLVGGVTGGGNLLSSTICFVLNCLGRITIFGACRCNSCPGCWPCGSCHSQISNTARPASAKNRKPTSSIVTQPVMNLFVLL